MVAIPDDLTPQERALVEASVRRTLPRGVAPGAVPRSWVDVERLATLSEAQFAAEFNPDFEAVLKDKENRDKLDVGKRDTVDRTEAMRNLHTFIVSSPVRTPEQFIALFEAQKAEYEAQALQQAQVQTSDVAIAPAFSNACHQAIIELCIEVLSFGLSLFGLWGIGRTVANKLLRNVPYSKVSGFREVINRFKNATTGTQRAWAFFDLIMEVIGIVGGIWDVLDSIWSEMGFWERIFTFAVLAVQVIAWFASGGLALIAQVAGVILSIVPLTNAAINVSNRC